MEFYILVQRGENFNQIKILAAILILKNYGATTESCLDDVLETFENYREFLGSRGGSP
jgi:hypothetical protein